MPRVKRTHRWVLATATALVSCYIANASAAISPPLPGSCKPVAPEQPPADNKGKAPKPGNGEKAEPRPAGERTVRAERNA